MSSRNKTVSPSPKAASSAAPVNPPNFDATIDVTAQNGAFDYAQTQLFLQMQAVSYDITPSGFHGEKKIFIDLTAPKNQQRLALYFDAATLDGLAIDFKLSITPIDDHLVPTGPPQTYEWNWTTDSETPAFIDGPVYLQDMKPPGTGGSSANSNAKSK